MSAEEKIAVLTSALEVIREATFAEFQLEVDSRYGFRPKREACPLCRRASTAKHLADKWAFIQAEAVKAIRETAPKEPVDGDAPCHGA